MSQQTHIIRRQVIELETAGQQQDAQLLQNEISRIYKNRLIDVLEQQCNALSTPDQIVRLDYVELDLGNLARDDFETELVEKFHEILYKELNKQISEQQGQNRHNIKTTSQLELLTFFLNTGSLPWWADASKPDILKTALHDLIDAAPDALREIIQQFREKEKETQRLLNQFTDGDLANLLRTVFPHAEILLAHGTKDAIGYFLQAVPGHEKKKLRGIIWRNILKVSLSNHMFQDDVKQWLTALVTRIASDTDLKSRQLLKKLHAVVPQKQDSKLNQIIEEILQEDDENLQKSQQDEKPVLPTKKKYSFSQITRVLQAVISDEKRVDQTRLLTVLDGKKNLTLNDWLALIKTGLTKQNIPQQTVQKIIDKARQELSQEKAIQTNASQQNLEDDDGDALYLPNAGLVLLWPFLKTYFTNLNLLTDNQFTNNEKQMRAVHLLQFLVDGQTEWPEYMLALNKILCGFALTDVIDPIEEISEEEKQESLHFLAQVIHQAPILKEMSIPGFRQTFLQRQAALRSRDGAWLLQVEQETYDVVLDRFPWNWQWIKLPWMETALQVEW